MFLRNVWKITPYADSRDVFKILVGTIIIFTTLCVSSVASDICDVQGHGLRIVIKEANKTWFYVWDSNGALNQNAGYIPEREEDMTSVNQGGPDKRADTLPHDLAGTNMRFDAPFLVSHNKRILVATIYPDSIGFGLSKRLALIDLQTKSLVRLIDKGDYIRSVVWHPTDKYFAVLYSHDVTKDKWRGPIDWIAGYLGHPISYYTMIAVIFDIDGKMICKRTISERLKHGRGYLEWKEKAEDLTTDTRQKEGREGRP